MINKLGTTIIILSTITGLFLYVGVTSFTFDNSIVLEEVSDEKWSQLNEIREKGPRAANAAWFMTLLCSGFCPSGPVFTPYLADLATRYNEVHELGYGWDPVIATPEAKAEIQTNVEIEVNRANTSEENSIEE